MGTKIFHFHHHHHGARSECGDIPRGCFAIMVGQGEEQQRFIVPLIYINHPLFLQLLKEAEEEYGFKYEKGPISIPCHVAEFRHVQGMIDREQTYPHHHHHHLPCFRVWWNILDIISWICRMFLVIFIFIHVFLLMYLGSKELVYLFCVCGN